MKSKNTLPILGCVAILLGGCVAAGQPGENPGPIPPRIVSGKNSRIWDNPSAFGKIPPGRQEEGDITCRNADFDHATGFHPDARNVYGGQIPRGGFYCVGKKDNKKDASSSAGS